jgi:single stranded DNA-binding protein
MAVARFTIAIDRGKDRNGEDRGADFPAIVCFGKTAELVERYLTKGRLVGIQGRIQTGKYEKDVRSTRQTYWQTAWSFWTGVTATKAKMNAAAAQNQLRQNRKSPKASGR